MKYFFSSARVLAADFAATILFLAVYEITHTTGIAAAAGLALGLGQVGWKLARREPVDALQWISLALVVMSGSASILTGDPRFVMVKPSVIYCIIGAVMLKRGWMMRYVPPIVREHTPELVTAFGYVWAGLMFASAVLNVALALQMTVPLWAVTMSIWGAASKGALFVVQFLIIRAAIVRKVRAAAVAAAA